MEHVQFPGWQPVTCSVTHARSEKTLEGTGPVGEVIPCRI